jgi:hypothetical protein
MGAALNRIATPDVEIEVSPRYNIDTVNVPIGSGYSVLQRVRAGRPPGAAAILAAWFLMTGVLFGNDVGPEPPGYALLLSPKSPVAGGTLRILAAGEEGLGKARILVAGPSGNIEAGAIRAGGGPPFWWRAEIRLERPGTYTVTLADGREELARRDVEVSAGPRPAGSRARSVWETEKDWDRDAENLYAAWIDALFRDADERSSWAALHEVTRDPGRNILHDHLGRGEDDPGGKNTVVMEPDCADNPFYLRAYFAWKLGLPFGFHECDRGTLERAPRTGRWVTNASASGPADPVRAFNGFLRNVMNTIHSGTARTRLEDDDSDYYPVGLTRKDLRPGVVFADPYGHTLILVRWVPQEGDGPGALLAVDAQPDGTVGVKRFWRGNFLFTTSEIIGEPGFKAFRPIVGDRGRPRLLRNAEIAASPDYGNLSLRQKGMASAGFYDTMERLINPKPLDPEIALRDLFKALHEQLIVRVESVANGEAYMKGHPGAIVPMPGIAAAVFQAGGLWEDYSTPNRDMRLLIAMDTVLEFPDKVVRSPDLYRLPKRRAPEEVRKDLEGLSGNLAREMSVAYVRSDGREQRLSLADVLERRDAFEIGYNPNDSVEIRWGAPTGSAELSSGRRRAPASQSERMRALRPWFRKRLHPPT